MDRIDIALAPDLDIKAQDFVDAWNAGEESRADADAEVRKDAVAAVNYYFLELDD